MIIKNLKLKKMCLECGINFKTYKMLFKGTIKVSKEQSNIYENKIAYLTLWHFMVLDTTKLSGKISKLLYKIYNLDLDRISYDEDLKLYKYQHKDKIITFDKLSNKTLDEELKQELLSKKRYKKCHSKSSGICASIENSKAVTGYVTIKNIKFLHTIVELVKDNENMVIDYTNNLYISKEQYYDLTKFKVIDSIDSDIIFDYFQIINDLEMMIKPSLCFSKEIMVDLEKNKHLFDKDEDKTKQYKL